MKRIEHYLPRLLLPAAVCTLTSALVTSDNVVVPELPFGLALLDKASLTNNGGLASLVLALLGLGGSLVLARLKQSNSCKAPWRNSVWLIAYTLVSAPAFWLAFSNKSSVGSQVSALFLALCAGWCMCRTLDDTYGFSREKRRFALQDVFALLVIFFAGVFFGSLGINSTFHTGIGDEGSFFEAAYSIAQQGISEPFRWNGVYGKFPWFDSILQSFGLTLVSPDIRGWRSIPITAVALGGALLYLFSLLWLNNRAVGFCAGMLLVCSHMLGALALIAYNNVHVLVSALTMLNVAAWYYLSPRPSRAYVLGATIGFSSYMIWGSAHVLPLIALMCMLAHTHTALPSPGAPTVDEHRMRRLIVHVACVALATALCLLPGLMVTQHDALRAAVLDLTNISRVPSQSLPATLLSALDMSRENVSVIWTRTGRYSHFVFTPITDRITGGLWALGILVCLIRMRSIKYRVVLGWPCVTLLSLILTLPPGTPPYFTRLFMIIPPVCLIAAIAGVELQRLLRLDRTRLRCTATLTLFPMVFLLNYHRLHIEVPSIQPISLRGLFAELGAKYPNARLVSIRAGTETDITQNTLMRLFPYLRDRVFTLPNNQSVPLIEPGSDSAPTLYVWTVDCLKADAHLERFDSSDFHIISAKYAPYGPEYLVYVATHDLAKLKPAIEAPW